MREMGGPALNFFLLVLKVVFYFIPDVADKYIRLPKVFSPKYLEFFLRQGGSWVAFRLGHVL